MKRLHQNQRAVTVAAIQKLDTMAIGKYHVPSIVLMENAGKAVAVEAVRLLKKIPRPHCTVVCGLGNNAGDGLVAARHLFNAGVQVNVFLAGSPEKLKNDAAANYRILVNCGYRIKPVQKITAAFKNELKRTDLIVDAIFGVGLNRTVDNPFACVIEALNGSGQKILSVDIPSGLDGTDGFIYGTCVKAYKTITFSCLKKGLVKKDGPKYAGWIEVADIGIPRRLFSKI